MSEMVLEHSPSLDLIAQPAAGVPPSPYGAALTEQQAYEYLFAAAGMNEERPRPSIRTLAKVWGWHRSRVERFLKKIDVENTETIGETPTETAPLTTTQSEAPAEPADDEGTEPDFFAPDSPDLVQAGVPAIAIYENVNGQIAIRAWNWPDEDAVIVVSPASVPAVIRRLHELRMQIERHRDVD